MIWFLMASALAAEVKIADLKIAACGPQIRLQVVREWEKSGFRRGEKFVKGYEDWAAALRRDVGRLSLKLANDLLPIDQRALLAPLEFSDDGRPDTKVNKDGDCEVRAVVIDANAIRAGARFMAQKTDFERMPPFDRHVALLLLSGVSPDLIRTLFDENSETWSVDERLERFQRAGIPSARYGDLDIDTNPKSYVRVDGRMRVARSSQTSAKLKWDGDGNLREITDQLQYVSRRLVRGEPALPATSDISCKKTVYRANGFLTLCDWRYFDDQGLMVAELPVIEPGEYKTSIFEITTRYSYSRELARHFILTNAGSDVARVISFPNSNRVIAVYPLVGEVSCEGATAKLESRVELTLPAECTGVFRVDYAP